MTEIKVLDKGYVQLISAWGDDQEIARVARGSYGEESRGLEKDLKLVESLMRRRHTSPFEQVGIKFKIKMPIYIARQYMRHRMQSINELSARYTELQDDYYVPDHWRSNMMHEKQATVDSKELDHLELAAEYNAACEAAFSTYRYLLQMGVCREQARGVLPLCTYTTFIATWDIHNLLHFISLRDDAHAQWEMQEYAKAMKKLAAEAFPVTISAFERGRSTKAVKRMTLDQWEMVPDELREHLLSLKPAEA